MFQIGGRVDCGEYTINMLALQDWPLYGEQAEIRSEVDFS